MRFPTIEHDPYGKDIRLQACHVGKPFTPTPEHIAAADLERASDVWLLLMRIAATQDFSVEHGAGESFICYRGYRIGGIDRKKGHWFISQTLGTYAIDRFLRLMKFQKRSGIFASAQQTWYELDLVHVAEFEHTLAEVSKAIDLQLKVSAKR